VGANEKHEATSDDTVRGTDAGTSQTTSADRARVQGPDATVVMEAYVHGTSTRKVDDLVRALGVDSGIAKAEVSPGRRSWPR
jgi:transposase-like protein